MVLSRKEAKGQSTHIKENPHKYVILDSSNLGYRDDIKKFSHAIEILNVINKVQWINDFSKDLKSNNYINPDILHQTIDAIFSEKSFTDNQLIKYYEVKEKIESFSISIEKFKEIDAYLPLDIEFMLLGVSFEKYSYLSPYQLEKYDNEFDLIYTERTNNIIDLKIFVQKAKSILSEFNDKKEPVLN